MANITLSFEELVELAIKVYGETQKDRLGQPLDPDGTSVPHIRNAIGVAAATLLRMQGGVGNVSFPEKLYTQCLIPGVMSALKMQPITDPDGTVHRGFIPGDLPDISDEKLDFNRLSGHLLEQEFLGLRDALKDIRTQRHLLLVELFAHREPDPNSPVLAHLELIDREMVNLRERITSFCAEIPHFFADHPKLRNPLIPPPDTSRDEPTFKQAIAYDQRKHDFLEIFQPSPPEEILLPDLPDFREREWHLFHFTFSSDTSSSDTSSSVEYGEEGEMVGDSVFDEDIRLLHHRLIERKMLIAYTILVRMITDTRESEFGVNSHVLYLPFQTLCDDIYRLRVAHLRATIGNDEDDDEEQLPPSGIEAQLLKEYREIADIQGVLKSYQTQLGHMDSLSVLVCEAYFLATQFVERYLGILEDETSSPQQKQEKVATLRASLNTKFEVCLQLLSQQEEDRSDEWRDPLFDKIARTINSLSTYLNTDGHISE